jgi:putative lysine transport system permease protein
MDRLTLLFADIGKLLHRYGGAYLSGVWNTLALALAATVIGSCFGFVCGVLNNIPHAKTDHPARRFLLGLVR